MLSNQCSDVGAKSLKLVLRKTKCVDGRRQAMKNLKKPTNGETLINMEEVSWWHQQLSPNAVRRLAAGWQGVFQRSILKLMGQAAEALGEDFDEELGRPSKELYAMSGLLLIAEFQDWTIDEAAEQWTLNAGVQYALNLGRDRQYLSARTLDNYRRQLREKVDVQEIFLAVAGCLVGELELDIRQQRLDSTHVLSAMARLGRQQLLAVAVKRFLVALHKRDRRLFGEVTEELRQRYEAAESRLFGMGTKQPMPRGEALAQVAQDLAWLVDHFASAGCQRWESYQALVRLLKEHCEVREDRTVVVRAQSRDAQGGSTQCLQNPSDPEAGYSGHKGAGYQMQLGQMLPPRDAEGNIEGPGLLTACVPQSAAVRDDAALPEVLAQQGAGGLLPERLTADTIYGSDDNVQGCAAVGVKLISPVGGVQPTKADAARHWCSRKERERKARLAQRRAEQETSQWRKQYAARSGIEGVHRALDVTTGCKRLRVRGLRAVTVALSLKATGWNILAAAKIRAHRNRKDKIRAEQALRGKTSRFKMRSQRLRRRRSVNSNSFFDPATIILPPVPTRHR